MQTDTQGSLKDRFKDFGAAPSDALWESIAASLDEDKKRRGAFWWWLIGSAAAVGLVVLVYQAGYKAGITKGGQATPIEIVQDTGNGAGDLQQQEMDDPAATGVEEPQNATAGFMDKQDHTEYNQTAADLRTSPGLSRQDDAGELPGTNTTAFGKDPGPVDTFDPANRAEEDMVLLAKLPSPAIVKPIRSPGSPFSLVATTVQVFPKVAPEWEAGINVGTSFHSMAGNKSDAEYIGNTADTGSLTSTPTFTGSAEPYHVELARPLTVELTLGRSLGQRWMLQTGLALAVSKSTGYFKPNALGLDELRHRYLAVHIPLHIAFDYFQRRRVECYAALGVNNEFPFHTRSIPVYEQSLTSTFDLEEKKQFKWGYQGSAQFSLGFRYWFSEHLKLDLRPNFRYYFRDQNPVVPAVSQRGWSGISVGLTWAF